MNTPSFKKVEKYCNELRTSLDKLCKELGPIQIGSAKQFPSGWGKAAKGRTVWRIVEEAIIQNLVKKCKLLGYAQVCPSQTEVSIFDVVVSFLGNGHKIYLNLKTAVAGKETKKGDISKAEKIVEFFIHDPTALFFIVTFGINFQKDMKITIEKCLVTPIAWLPDIYVNPSNNANLQSRQPNDLKDATQRTNAIFIEELQLEMEKADRKRKKTRRRVKKPSNRGVIHQSSPFARQMTASPTRPVGA